MRSWLKSVATIDLRSLALFRVLLGAVVILDLLNRWPDIGTHYTDAGLLPRDVMISNFNDGRLVVLQLLNGAPWFSYLLVLVHLVCAVALMVGYRTRVAVFLVWLLELSLQGRIPQIVYGGDVVLRMILLWANFLPLNARFSIDRWLDRKSPELPARYSSFAVFGLYAQLMSIYFFTALIKHQFPAWQEGMGIYYAVAVDSYATPLGLWLSHHLELLRPMTYFVLAFELIGSFLLLVTWRNGLVRLPLVLAFIGFHVGMGLCLDVRFFQLVSSVAWTVALPAFFWEKLPREWDFRKRFSLEAWRGKIARYGHGGPYPAASAMLTAGAAIICFISLYWNLTTVSNRFQVFEPVGTIGRALGIDQSWSMFAKPFSKTGWFIIPAKLSDGSDVDLFRNGAELDWEKSPYPYQLFRNERWRKYMYNIMDEEGEAGRLAFGRYLCHRWNGTHADPTKKLEAFKVIYRNQVLQANGERGPEEPYLLWRHECEIGLLKKWDDRIAMGPPPARNIGSEKPAEK